MSGSDQNGGEGAADPGPGRPGHVCPTRSLAGRCRCRGGPDQLKQVYRKARDASLAKLEEAIDSLEKGPNPGPVSLDTIHVRSVQLRAAKGEKGIAVSTILGDPRCAKVYYARRTRNPMSTPPSARTVRKASGRILSRDLRKLTAENLRLRRDIASIGAARARTDRARVDGEEPDGREGS